MENVSKEQLSEIIESLNTIMLTNPDLYLKLAHEEFKNNKNLKILDVDIKYIVKSNFVYIDISSPMTKDIIKLGSIFRLELKIGFTKEMLKPQIKVGSQYRQAETLEELNTSELTVSFDNFLEKDMKTDNEGVTILEVEAVLHEMVFEKISKDEIFKYYMISIIHDRILLRLKAQIVPQNSQKIIEKIFSKAIIEKLIPKSGTSNQIGFSKNEMTIYDLEFMKMKKQSIKHVLNLTCYTSYDELLSEKDSELKNVQQPFEVQTKVVEEVEFLNHRKTSELPKDWKELDNLSGIQIKNDYLPIKFKALLSSGKLVFLFQFNGPKEFISNLYRANANVSILSARVTYDSNVIIHINLENFIQEYHQCSLCKPTFDYKNSILMCNQKFLKLSLTVNNICDAVKHKLKI
ncbi:uncharacterized protein cubi_02073 [Cryptosporidium ubiquitum]|uniref:Uncharacterized protein n=1 Tax=Cryptosporidium ubiquitum TaxID=857276 RepID=A0A1J4MMY9_9CRYT|nr:uncharacterized protein cubi_02073 [Cryptosporidium ubiquitum]OII75552.1 hypothetical protein cubi_02073 [Cryptosporidium ubiquitum]